MMKKFYFLFLVLFSFTSVNAQIINFPDANFKAKLLTATSTNYMAYNLSGHSTKIDTNNNGEIENGEAYNISFLDISNSNIQNIQGIEYFTSLGYFNCSGNSIQSIVLSNFFQLGELNCDNNELTSLNLTGLTNLQLLNCRWNQLTSLNVSGLTNLQRLYCYDNQITSLNASALTNLHELNCSNNQIISLNLNGLSNLYELNFCNNQISSLNVSGLTNLNHLYAFNNQLTTLNLSGLTNLQSLYCNENQLTSLNINGLTNLRWLYCNENQLTLLNLNGLSNLFNLECSNNQLTSLDLSGLTNIDNLSCNGNPLTSLDIRDLTRLNELYCNNNNELTSLFIKNGKNEIVLNLSNNPNLHYVCADDTQINQIQNLIASYGYTNCTVNSYCSFTPGGNFYIIQGNNKFDSNNNGCDGNDMVIPNLKFTITDGTMTGNIISNTSGIYNIPVQAGTHTITPILENPSYIHISPSSINVSFPLQAGTFSQNFCITPYGSHLDLEVTILPVSPARPGFDAIYKVIYKNKGNIIQSGSVNFTFDDMVLDLVSASPATANQTLNNLSWDYINLLPFETREITLTLNVNSPMETPPVNIGNQLNFAAVINPVSGDEIPADNNFGLKQIVVGSFDPNDKTCLEGATLSPSMIGEYVHYMIRFENTGTFPAQNIVVKDNIDTTKFDISTLVPIKGSHSFVTRITEGNKVEFIFENINLPFDNANNDGFVAFKIKTLPTLVLGDSFENTANIYFDYNFPIITNTATTIIQSLGTSDFEFSKYFTLYPNPAKELLNLSIKNGIEVTSINIYNALGQLVNAIPNAQTVSTIDVSRLAQGSYFIKVNTDKGTSNTKFIKK